MLLNLIKSKINNQQIGEDEGMIIFLNPFTYLCLRNRKELISKCSRIYIDGIWLCYFLKWFGVVDTPRVSFDNSSLAPIVFTKAMTENKRVALIGSDENVAKKFLNYVKKQYPQLCIVYSRSGFFSSETEVNNCYKKLIGYKADIVIVGMGALNQEEFLAGLFSNGWNGVGYSCGGFMHQTSSKGHHYYANWVNKFNLRFVYRIWDEPKLIKRYTLDYMRFVIVFICDYFLSRKTK